MTAIMQGVRVVEVAEQGFVPGAGALLSDYGAEVIKVEPTERGDAARGLTGLAVDGVNILFQHANRGKKSIALDLSTDAGRDVLYRLARRADVFITNKLPAVLKRLKIEPEDIRAHNPDIIYVRGTGQGVRGPEADRGAYDFLTFWHRAGASYAVRSPRGEIPFLPAPGFGDFTGSMFIVGGVMGALLHRERTGEAKLVDVSLLSTGLWAMGASASITASEGHYKWPPPIRNPLSQIYATRDGGHVAVCCLQAARYWAPLCELLGRPDLAADPRFKDYAALIANSAEAERELAPIFAQATLAEWRERLDGFSGQWTTVQDVPGVVHDPQALANGYLQDCETADGRAFKLVAPPVQFDETPATPRRAPDFNEHGDEILAELGLDTDALIDLKLQGVVA